MGAATGVRPEDGGVCWGEREGLRAPGDNRDPLNFRRGCLPFLGPGGEGRVLPRAGPGPIFPVSTSPRNPHCLWTLLRGFVRGREPKGDGGKGTSVF